MIVLKFQAPNGEVGFTEAHNDQEAMRTVKLYMADGYTLLEQYNWEDERHA